MKKISWSLLFVLIAFVWSLSTHTLLVSFAHAQPPTPDMTSTQPLSCEQDVPSISVISSQALPAGDVYVKLNVPGTQQNIRTYIQPMDGSACKLLAETNTNADTWSAIGRLDEQAVKQPFSFVIYSAPASSNPYQAVASLLIITDAHLCKPTKDCVVNYSGHSGTLTPQKLSSSSDPIILNVATPLPGSYTSVDYYVDNHFAYASQKLEAINLSYLSGGTHAVSRVLNFSNGEKLTLTQTLDMGIDANGNLYIKSWFYRQKGSIRILIITGAAALLIVSFVGLLRLIHRRRLYRTEHGLDNYKSK